LINADEAVGELVNIQRRGLHAGYCNDDDAADDECATACIGRAIWPIATPAGGYTWLDGEAMAAHQLSGYSCGTTISRRAVAT
jgi:hypothetical protein